MDDSTGSRLRAWRERQEPKLSQTAAAERIGTKQRTWGDWETDKAAPDVDFAEAIERMTGREVRMCDWAEIRRQLRLHPRRRRKGGSGRALPVAKAS